MVNIISSAFQHSKIICYILWAAVVGASVTASVLANIHINHRAPEEERSYHSIYVGNVAVLIGGLVLIPPSACSKKPCKKPAHMWSLLGGLCTMPGFITIPASVQLGTQVVLLIQLSALILTALVFDLRSGRLSFSDKPRVLGFVIVLLGVSLDSLDAVKGGGEAFSISSLVFVIITFISGIGYGLQAKCNSRLARDVGSTPRAVAISAAVNLVSGIPLDLAVRYYLGVSLYISWNDWALLLASGAQSGFYIGSLAVLPRSLGYTLSYLALLSGKLVSSSAADAAGLTGKVVPFGWARALSLALVFFGAGLFSKIRQPPDGADMDDSSEVVVDGSFIRAVSQGTEGTTLQAVMQVDARDTLVHRQDGRV